MKTIILSLLLCVFLYSCDSKEEKFIKGVWTIDSIEQHDENIIFELYSNLIIFKDNDKCILPKSRDNVNTNGKWSLFKENDTSYITINAKESNFSGKFAFNFSKDHNSKLIKLHLSSVNTKITCSKMLTNFDSTKLPEN